MISLKASISMQHLTSLYLLRTKYIGYIWKQVCWMIWPHIGHNHNTVTVFYTITMNCMHSDSYYIHMNAMLQDFWGKMNRRFLGSGAGQSYLGRETSSRAVWCWNDNSINKMPTLQTWGSEFNTQNPCTKKQSIWVQCIRFLQSQDWRGWGRPIPGAW